MEKLERFETRLRGQAGERETQYELVLAHLRHGRNAQALRMLEEMLRFPCRDARLFYARGAAYLSMSDYRKAGCDFLRTIVLDRDFIDAYRHLAFVQLTLGKEEAALKTLKSALARDSSDALLYCVLGDVYLDTGEWEQAREAFEKALDLEPRSAEPHCKLAMYYVSRGDMEGLKKEYEILKDLAPEMAGQIECLFFQLP